MGIEIKAICDRCNAIREPGSDLYYKVAIICEPTNVYGDTNWERHYHPTRHQEALWCPKCVQDMDVRQPLLRSDETEKPPTIEEIVRNIVREENGNG